MEAVAMNRAQRRAAERRKDTTPPRRIRVDTMNAALRRATRLTASERAVIINPARDGLAALRQGVATVMQWQLVSSALQIAQAIEATGVITGLQGHLQQADQALDAIHQRVVTAEGGPSWGRFTPPPFHEIDALTDAIDLHEWQLEQLSFAEFTRARLHAETEVRRRGGRVLGLADLTPEELHRLEEAAR